MTDGIEQAFALLGQTTQPQQSSIATADGSSPVEAPTSPRMAELQAQLETERAKNAELVNQSRREALKGKVSDVDLALKVLDLEKHLDAQGNININALKGEFPGLAPAGVLQQTAPDDAGGGTQTMTNYRVPTLQRAIQSGETPIINMAFDEALKTGNRNE